jgi:hypothetical protein
VRGIVELNALDHGRGLRHGNPEHGGVVGWHRVGLVFGPVLGFVDVT